MDVDTNTSVQNGAQGDVSAQNNAGNTNTQTDTKTGFEGNSEGNKGNTQLEGLEALIQKAVDRATNKLGNENKALKKQLEDFQKAKLSDDELKQLEIKQKEEEIAERERKLTEQENRLYAIKAIKEVGLDDGSDMSLALVDFVMAEDETAIKERVKSFNALVERFVKAQVDKTFKSVGRTPGKGTSATGSDSDDKQDSVAVRIGKNVAKANEAAKNTLDFYTGGNRK